MNHLNKEQINLIDRFDVDQSKDSFMVSDLIKERNIKCFVEIGVSRGGSLAFYSYVLPKECIIVGIDNGCIAEEFSDIEFLIEPEFYDIIKNNCNKPYLISGNSHSVKTYDKLVDIIDEKSIDFLHIDGDHTYEGVSDDFNTYFELVSPGGIIVIHDICSEPGVKKFWRNTKSRGLNMKEIQITSYNSNIGVIFKDF